VFVKPSRLATRRLTIYTQVQIFWVRLEYFHLIYFAIFLFLKLTKVAMLIATVEICQYMSVTMLPMIPASMCVKAMATSLQAANTSDDYFSYN